MSLPASTLASIQHAVSDQLKRPCVSFAPCIWGDTFLEYASQFEVLYYSTIFIYATMQDM